MKHLILLILTLTILATSCDKDKNLTVVSGVVVQKSTLKPIHNAELIITQSYHKGVFSGRVEWPIDTVYTDQDGRFEWKTDINPRNDHYKAPGKFQVKIVKAENYFEMNTDAIVLQGNKAYLRHLDKVDLNIQMTPHAYLELSLINAPVPNTDYCRFFVLDSNIFEEKYGGNSFNKLLLEGNQINHYWYTYDPELSDWKKDSFYLQAFETKKLEILY